MPTFTALMKVTRHETWDVEAANEDEARELIAELDDAVMTDELGGETVDWDIVSIKPTR